MYCNQCGKANLEGAAVCAHCGAPLTEADATTTAPAPAATGRRSGLAIASLVVNLFNLLGGLGLPALAGLVLGTIALVQIGRSRGRLRGRGLAIAGICVSGAALVVQVGFAVIMPAAAQARESAHKAQCMANMKSIAAAITMYLAEYDAFPPKETRREVLAFFDAAPGGKGPKYEVGLQSLTATEGNHAVTAPAAERVGLHCPKATEANPYLQWPVVLDDYINNRDVWKCPSARLKMPARFINGERDWFGHLRADKAQWQDGRFCVGGSLPAGWGGEVTDTLAQGRLAVPLAAGTRAGRPMPMMKGEIPQGVFVQSVAVNGDAAGQRTSAIDSAEAFVVCADGGGRANRISTGTLAYPDICGVECALEACKWFERRDCPIADECGLKKAAPRDGSFLGSPMLLKPYTRHLGGVNIGFADGHAKWYSVQAVLAGSPTDAHPDGMLEGYGPAGPTRDCGFVERFPGAATLYGPERESWQGSTQRRSR